MNFPQQGQGERRQRADTPDSESPSAASGQGNPIGSHSWSPSSEEERCWVGDNPQAEHRLWAIVTRLESNPSDREDLFQEGLLHLWFKEREHPGQTLSWYLQSCWFHLHDLNRAGCGLGFRPLPLAKARVTLRSDKEEECWGAAAVSEGDLVSEICAHDLIAALDPLLKPPEKAVLDLLSQGFGTREVARRLRISGRDAIKRRRAIASLTIALGISPGNNSRFRNLPDS